MLSLHAAASTTLIRHNRMQNSLVDTSLDRPTIVTWIGKYQPCVVSLLSLILKSRLKMFEAALSFTDVGIGNI